MRIPPFAVVLAALAAACVREPDPLSFSEDVVSVHTVLHAFDTEPRVWVRRSTFAGQQRPGNAAATLASGGTSLALAQAAADDPHCGGVEWGPEPLPGCLGATLPEPVAPGSRWTLTASVAGVGTVQGATTVPELPQVARPGAGIRVPFARGQYPGSIAAEMELEWSAPGAPRVEFGVRGVTAYARGAVVTGAVCWVGHQWIPAAIDRSSGARTVRFEHAQCTEGRGTEVAWDSLAVEVAVTAFDPAYANFVLYGSGTSGRRAGLEGGYGVVGSAATTRRMVMLVPGG